MNFLLPIDYEDPKEMVMQRSVALTVKISMARQAWDERNKV
jgi:hypothetical protein